MSALPLALDHVGVAVRSLDTGRDTYAHLGFTLTPRSIHSGSRTPGGPVEPWGSGNHCAMFDNGYLEIIGLTDPNLYSSARPMLERYQGAHIVAIGSGEADAAFAALSRRFDGVQAPASLQRQAAFGPKDEETRLAAFRNIYVDPARFPEAKLIFIEHLTRDVLWQPHLLKHANGATGIAEVALCVADPAGTCGKLSKLLAREPKQPMPGVAVFALDRGNIYVVSPEGLAGWIKGVAPPCLPWVAAVGFTVKDLAATKAFLAGRDIPVTAHKYPAVWVAPDHTCGPVVSFIQG